MDPAQPPTKLEKIRITGRAPGHLEKSSVVNPVVVAIETTWNNPFDKVSPTEE